MLYAELHPNELARRISAGAAVVLPIGALQWHGDHLPLGLDLFVAKAFAELVCARLDGILLPALLVPATTAPHPLSLQVSASGFRSVMDDTLAGLVRGGFETIVVVSGQHAPGHEIELYEAALSVMDDHPGVRIFAAAPLEPLGDDSLLDHGGRVETSLLLAIRPELVRLQDFDGAGVLGEDPRGSSIGQGEQLFEKAIDAWTRWASSDARSLLSWYGARFDYHQPFVDAYFKDSWEDANLAWWAEQTTK